MDISVVMPAYNAESYIQYAIDSVLNQQFRGTFELIIVNDCSTDMTSTILEKNLTDYRVKILHTPKNTGYPGAMNIGLRHASGKYVSRMDADDLMDPALLQMTFDFHEIMGEDVAFVSCKRYWISFSGYPYHKKYDLNEQHIYENWDNLINRKRSFTDVGTLFRRDLVEAVGGYNEYQRSGMDVDFWLRILEYTQKPCLTLAHPLVGKRLLPESIIFRPNTTNANNIPRELAILRTTRSLPVNYRPSKDWLDEVKKEYPDTKKTLNKVGLSMEVAFINHWLGDKKGYSSFLRLSFRRNPLMTMKLLIHRSLFKWKHDFIEGRPALEPLTMRISKEFKTRKNVDMLIDSSTIESIK